SRDSPDRFEIADVLFMCMRRHDGSHGPSRQTLQVPFYRPHHPRSAGIDEQAIVENHPEVLSEDDGDRAAWKAAQEEPVESAIQKRIAPTPGPSIRRGVDPELSDDGSHDERQTHEEPRRVATPERRQWCAAHGHAERRETGSSAALAELESVPRHEGVQ